MDLQESRDKKPGKKGGRLRRQDSNQRAQSMWVIGGGQFGKKAVQRLFRENPMIDITVVEKVGIKKEKAEATHVASALKGGDDERDYNNHF